MEQIRREIEVDNRKMTSDHRADAWTASALLMALLVVTVAVHRPRSDHLPIRMRVPPRQYIRGRPKLR
jgi:hypothetical protein